MVIQYRSSLILSFWIMRLLAGRGRKENKKLVISNALIVYPPLVTLFHSLLVEFPCVLIDIDAGKITDEFQQYVQPQENTRLSSFCTELTGITQVLYNRRNV